MSADDLTKGNNGKSRRRRAAVRIAVYSGLGYLVIIMSAFFFQNRLIYFPVPLDRSEKITFVPGDEEVWIEAPKIGDIHGLYYKAPPDQPTILFLHGNAGNVQYWNEIYRGLAAIGAGLLMIDYPGYGKSEGSPSEEALYASSRAAVRFLENRGIQKKSIFIFGKSLGTAVAVETAVSGEFAGVILESPFTDIASIGQANYWFIPVSLLLAERYDTLSRIGQVRCPVLVIVGTEDKLVPPEQSLKVFSRACSPKKLVQIEGATHYDIQSVGGKPYWEGLRDWMEKTR